ncbi:MAG TPA: hypothetical protein VJ850_04640 [Candidatus Limnocylindrales bacterium]|nr:hypothetical protein [Candidatus Limnocylindrales bacterium]
MQTNIVPARRVAVFVVLAVLIVVGVLLFAYVVSPPRSDLDATPIPTPVDSGIPSVLG